MADGRDFGCLTTNNCMSYSLEIDVIKMLPLRFLLCDCHSSQQLGFSQHALVQRKVFYIGGPRSDCQKEDRNSKKEAAKSFTEFAEET